MTVPALLDPFEREHRLLREAAVLAFSPRAFEVRSDELLRWVGLDLAAGVPHELGATSERFPARSEGEARLDLRLHELGGSLAAVTEIDEPAGRHRVLEVLGVRGGVRARLNFTTGRGPGAVPLGNVRVFGGEPGLAERAIAPILLHLRLLGLEPRPAPAGVAEPIFEPPAAERLACELPPGDAPVLAELLALAVEHAAEGARPRPARRLSLVEDRARRPDGGSVAYRFELHRVATGVVHLRRREVEAGPERPALVRTWNVLGLRGGTRLRLRDVGGRAVAEIGGSAGGVSSVAGFLVEHLGARP